jgi:pilus assembly protein CpaB
VNVLTVTEAIDPGEEAGAAQSQGKFELTRVPKSSVVKGAVTTVEHMADQVALAKIYPGEQVLTGKFGKTAASEQTLTIPKGKIAVSVELTDPARVAGFVTPGSHVVVFVSAPETTNGTRTTAAYTRVLVSDVEVIGVGAATVLSGPAGDKPEDSPDEVPKTILTVALDQQDSARVLFAASTKGLAFGLLGEGARITRDRGVSAGDLHQ